MNKRKSFLPVVISMALLISNISTAQVFAEYDGTQKSKILLEENIDDKLKLFVSSQESLPDGLSVETTVISQNHVIQFFKDSNRNTEDVTEIKLNDTGIVIDYYSEVFEENSKIHTMIIPIEKLELEGSLENISNPRGHEDGGSYEWQYGSTKYSNKEFNGSEAYSIIKDKAIDYLLSFLQVPILSEVRSIAGTIADYAYSAKNKVTVKTERAHWWRHTRPNEAGNTYNRPYLNSWDYEVQSWSFGSNPVVLSRFSELYYANNH